MYNKVCIGKHLSDSFLIQNGLKQGYALSPPLFNFALEYTIRKVQDNQAPLKLNGICPLFANADDVNLLLSNNEENTETLTDANKEVGLEINAEKTKYMLLSRHQNSGKYHDIKIANFYFYLYFFFQVAPQLYLQG
jgi:hypothetical protein